MARRTYTDRDRALVYATLTANNGNIKRTARETQLPVSTVRDWKTEWEMGGLPPDVAEVLPAVIEDVVETFTRIRDKAVLELERLVDEGEFKGQPLVNAIGMLTDKIRLFQGQATSRRETTLALPEPEKVHELMSAFFREVVPSAELRAEEIIEAEWEPAQVALPPAESKEDRIV